VIHGAGVIEDKLLAHKAWESFERVFETKALGAFVLARALTPFRETLRFVGFFSSVAGAFANRGQADYVAGNEVANKLALALSGPWAAGGCRVVALNWGPWQKGMAGDAVQKQFRDRGIEPIAVPAGRRAMLTELASVRREPVVVLGNGPWARVANACEAAAAPLPLIPGSRVRVESGVLSMERVLDVGVEHFLDDHRLDGRPVLPMTVALEMLSELAARGWPDLPVTEVRDLAVLKGVVLSENGGTQQALRLEAQAIGEPSSAGATIRAQIASGTHPGQIHYRATLELGRSGEPPRRHTAAPVRREFPVSVREAYGSYLFHGPRFANIEHIDGATDGGLLARLTPSSPASCIAGGAGDWLIDPVVLDSGLQMVILWARTTHDVTPLPARFKAYRRYAPLRSRDGSSIWCELAARADLDARLVRADLTFFERDGTVLGVLEGLECTASRELNRLAGGPMSTAAAASWGKAK
jgi:hypothetical protein